jgi:hypothetical protein
MGKKLLSFCLYGDNPVYREGALSNLAASKNVYPDWICRFYVSQEIPESLTDRLADQAEVVRMHRRSLEDGTFWRFLPASEEDVDFCAVRDLDSDVTLREKQAVDEWIASGKGVHIMRDHPGHHFLIPGGLWGFRQGAIPDMAERIERWMQNHRTIPYGSDQEFLARNVYPLIKGDVFIHSDFIAFPGEQVHPFPSRRDQFEYIGHRHKRRSSEATQKHFEALERAMQRGLRVYPTPTYALSGPRKVLRYAYRPVQRIVSFLRHLAGSPDPRMP